MTKKQVNNKRKEFGLILKDKREGKGLKITQAAKAMGISHQNLSNLEEGKHFNFCTACVVCSFYQLEMSIIEKAVKQ